MLTRWKIKTLELGKRLFVKEAIACRGQTCPCWIAYKLRKFVISCGHPQLLGGKAPGSTVNLQAPLLGAFPFLLNSLALVTAGDKTCEQDESPENA